MSAIIQPIDPRHPEPHRIASVARRMRNGALVLFPTDSVYAIGADPANYEALARLHRFKPSASPKPQTMMCASLSVASRFAHMDDDAFKLIKTLAPGPYVFILKGTREVPRIVLNPKRKTAGVRIPNHPITQALLGALDGIIISTTAKPLERDGFMPEPQSPWELFDALRDEVDVIIDDGEELRREFTTVIDLTTPEHEILREGLGMDAVAPFVR